MQRPNTHRRAARPWRRLLVATVITPLAFVAVSSVQVQRPFTIADVARIASLGDTQISPDAKWVAYTLTTIDMERDKHVSHVMLVSADGGTPRTLATGSSPKWSPDGSRIAFIGGEEEKNGIWLFELQSGVSRFVARVDQTDHFLGHSAEKNFVWSPDGASIAFVAAEKREETSSDDDPRVVDRIMYKTRTGFSDNRHTHIFLVDVASGAVRAVTAGTYDEHSIDFSLDGRHVAFVSNHSDNPDDNYSDDVFIVDIATGEVTRVTNTPGTEITPRFSPDGRQLAYLATTQVVNTKDSGAENWKLFVTDFKRPVRVATDFNHRIGRIAWSRDNGSIWFVAPNQGSTIIYRAPLSPGAEVVQEGDAGGRIGSYSMDASGQVFAYTRNSQTDPGEVRVYDSRAGTPHAITSHNEQVRNDLAMQQAETFWFNSFDGTRVQGWAIAPRGAVAGEKRPTILSIHGGPHGMYGEGFSDAFQLYSSAGFGVVYINPRGSTGYGQTFTEGTIGQWGGGDYRDLMLGLDAAIKRFDWIDSDRLGVIGGSYGGFMTNWVITQTHRFKAAVSVASVSNLVSFYGNSLYQLLIEVEFEGKPWDEYETLWRYSPIAHVKGVTTPTLFLHGERDHDVPISQAEEMFIALKKQGVEAVFVRYPREGHGVREPRHRADYYARILKWFHERL